MAEFVESIRYEADITDVTSKLDRLAREQAGLAGKTGSATSRMSASFAKFSSGLGNAVKSMAKAGAAMGAMGVAGAVVLAPRILEMGASFEALGQKARTVFSDGSLAQVQKWASSTASSMGMTQTEAIGVAASIGDLLKPMGFTAEQAAGMSTKLADLSGALSAWSGGTQTAAEVSDVLTKALLGERDGLKSLGISISEADVQTRLAAKGQAELTGRALEQAKALATQELILEKSADAQKAWSDGSMDAIKKQNQMKAALGTLRETFVKLLYPAVAKMVPVLESLATWLSNKIPVAVAAARTWFEANLLPTFRRVVDFIQGNWRQAFDALIGFFRTAFEGGKMMLEALARAFGTNEGTILKVLGGIAIALGAVAVAWNLGPGIIITGVVAVAAGLLYAYRRFEWFKKGVDVYFKAIGLYIRTWVRVAKWAFTEVFAPAVSWLWRSLKSAWDRAQPIVNAARIGIRVMAEGVRSYFNNIVKPAFETLGSIVRTAWSVASPIIDGMKSGIRLAFRAVKGYFNNILKPAFNTLGSIVQGAWDVASPVIDTIKTTIETMASAVSGAFDAVASAVRSGWNSVANAWNNSVGAMSFSIPDWIPEWAGGGKGFDMPNLPTLHTGGRVPGVPGQEVVMKLVAGETVRTNAQEKALTRDAGSGRQVMIGELHVHTTDQPRRFYDEALWRLAG